MVQTSPISYIFLFMLTYIHAKKEKCEHAVVCCIAQAQTIIANHARRR